MRERDRKGGGWGLHVNTWAWVWGVCGDVRCCRLGPAWCRAAVSSGTETPRTTPASQATRRPSTTRTQTRGRRRTRRHRRPRCRGSGPRTAPRPWQTSWPPPGTCTRPPTWTRRRRTAGRRPWCGQRRGHRRAFSTAAPRWRARSRRGTRTGRSGGGTRPLRRLCPRGSRSGARACKTKSNTAFATRHLGGGRCGHGRFPARSSHRGPVCTRAYGAHTWGSQHTKKQATTAGHPARATMPHSSTHPVPHDSPARVGRRGAAAGGAGDDGLGRAGQHSMSAGQFDAVRQRSSARTMHAPPRGPAVRADEPTEPRQLCPPPGVHVTTPLTLRTSVGSAHASSQWLLIVFPSLKKASRTHGGSSYLTSRGTSNNGATAVKAGLFGSPVRPLARPPHGACGQRT